MLTRFSPSSSTIDMRRRRSLSPGKAFATHWVNKVIKLRIEHLNSSKSKAINTNLKMAVVNFVNDLEMTRKNRIQHADGPSLKGFGQNSVIGVSASTGGNIPSL